MTENPPLNRYLSVSTSPLAGITQNLNATKFRSNKTQNLVRTDQITVDTTPNHPLIAKYIIPMITGVSVMTEMSGMCGGLS